MERLRELRITAGVSLMAAAQALGVSYTRMWSLEKGYAPVSEDVVKRLKDFYLGEITNRTKSALSLVEGTEESSNR